MMKYFWFLAVFAGLSFLVGCDDDSDSVTLVGNWAKKGDFNGAPRSNASSFVINDIAYVVGGYNGKDGSSYYKNLYAYNAKYDIWEEKAEFPGSARTNGVAFAANGKGYYGTGYDGNNKLKDFYCYDPSTNKWDTISDFIGSARYGAVAFSVNGIGYVGTGYDDSKQNTKDFFAYNPQTDTWTELTGGVGEKRVDASAFVIGELAYVGLGYNNGENKDDLWRFDPSQADALQWTKLTKLDVSITRSNAVAFSINNLGYIATGNRNGIKTDVWEYDPVTDTWTERTSLEASARQDACGFTVGNLGYITTGFNGSSYFDDVRSFDPTAVYDSEDN